MGGQVASFSFPTAIVFGSGALAGLAKRLRQMGCRRALVVTDKPLVQTPAFDLLANHLGRANLGKTWELFDGVHSNPLEEDVAQAAKTFRDAPTLLRAASMRFMSSTSRGAFSSARM